MPAILLTTLLAVLLCRVRGWMQRRLHRALFGDRERQFGMLSELGARLEQAGEPRDLLARLAEAVRDGLDASWVRIRLATTDGALAESPAGSPATAVGEPAESVDLVHADETLGRIDVGARRRGEYSDAERTLLRTVAGQAAASVANVRLTAQLAEQLDELTASRERLVAAQDDERRRLERDLHDGIQQNIVAQIAGLRLARNRLQRGELAPEELVELQDQARETLTDLRELARGIHPPVLSDNGLVAAVESGVARYPIPLEVEADEAVRAERFPEEVETTAYYVVREALANTAKHADATHASVGLAREQRAAAHRDHRRRPRPRTPAPATSHERRLANIRDRVAALRGTRARVVRADGSGGGRPPVASSSLPRGGGTVTEGTLRVVIAEDNYLVREGVRRLLEDSGEVEVVAGTGTRRNCSTPCAGSRPMRCSPTSGCRPATTWRASRRPATSAPRTPTRASSCSRSTPTRATRSRCSPTARPGWATC